MEEPIRKLMRYLESRVEEGGYTPDDLKQGIHVLV